MCDAGNLLQVQFERFVDQEFVEASVFAENEGIIEARDPKNVLDFEGHQVVEALEARFSVEKGLDDGAGGHNERVNSQSYARRPDIIAKVLRKKTLQVACAMHDAQHEYFIIVELVEEQGFRKYCDRGS